MTAKRVRKEQDKLCQTKVRLRTQRGTAHIEHDAVCKERNTAQQRVGSLEAKLEREKTQKLDAENTCTRLTTNLGWEK
jgi:seryl-tRNA synthetase